MLIYSLVRRQEAVSSLREMCQGGGGQRTRGPSQHELVARRHANKQAGEQAATAGRQRRQQRQAGNGRQQRQAGSTGRRQAGRKGGSESKQTGRAAGQESEVIHCTSSLLLDSSAFAMHAAVARHILLGARLLTQSWLCRWKPSIIASPVQHNCKPCAA